MELSSQNTHESVDVAKTETAGGEQEQGIVAVAVVVEKMGMGEECLHHGWLSNCPSSLPPSADVSLGVTLTA